MLFLCSDSAEDEICEQAKHWLMEMAAPLKELKALGVFQQDDDFLLPLCEAIISLMMSSIFRIEHTHENRKRKHKGHSNGVTEERNLCKSMMTEIRRIVLVHPEFVKITDEGFKKLYKDSF